MAGVQRSEFERGPTGDVGVPKTSFSSAREMREKQCSELFERAEELLSSIQDTSEECRAWKNEVYSLIEKSKNESSEFAEGVQKIRKVLQNLTQFVPADQRTAMMQRIEQLQTLCRVEVSGQIPPILDREVFFKDPEVCAAQISPDGKYIAFLKPFHNVLNVWVKKTDEPFDAARPVTNDSKRSIGEFGWSQDGRYILFFQDQGGNENFHAFAIDPYSESPTARDLTPFDRVKTRVLGLPKNSPNEMYVGLNDRDESYHDVYRIDLSTGQRTLVQQNNDGIAEWILDLSGRVRIGVRITKEGNTEFLRVDPDGMHPIWSCSVKEHVRYFAFHKDGRHLYMATDKGETDLSRLVLLDIQTGQEEVVDSDPEGEVDFEEPMFSEQTDELVATTYIGDRLRRYFKDKEWESDFKVLRDALPKGEIYAISSSRADDKWLVKVRSDVDPQSVYLYDRKTKKIEFLYRAFPSLPSEHLSPMEPIVYTSRDGLRIHGYLTVPKGKEPRDLPLLVFPHGGPWERDFWGYNSMVQFFANRGYAVLQMNFRGSTGYGKKFKNAGNKQFGEMMQDDITDGVKLLIDRQVVDPGRVAIFGVSYGGYATIAGLTFTPDVYKAGISMAGYANLLTLRKSMPEDWVAAKTLFNDSIGDPSNPEDVARMEQQSPLFSADKIVAPLMVFQGANDDRVKTAEADRIIVALQTLGKEVHYFIAPDEGHGFVGSENNLAAAVAMEKFLAQHIGGRCQEAVPAPIADRLRAITVDVNTVVLSDKQSTKTQQ